MDNEDKDTYVRLKAALMSKPSTTAQASEMH